MRTRIDPLMREHWRQLLEIFRDAELAEARAEFLRPYLDCLALSGLLEGYVILGESFLPLYTGPVEGGTDSGLYCQAALVIPGGLGVVLWSCDEHDALSEMLDGPEANAHTKFRPFTSCRPVVQQWLLPQIDGLFAKLFEAATLHTPGAPRLRGAVASHSNRASSRNGQD